MKFRPLVVGIGLLSVLGLTACSGDAGEPAGTGAAQSADQQPAPSRSDAARDTTTAHMSTFALDVDTASYGYARRSLQDGRLPDPGEIRPEEWVNAFRQDYAEPPGDGFTVHMDGARLNRDEAVLRVGLQTRAAAAAERRPANLTFVVDVSGSMAEADRLGLVKSALRTLLDQLGPGDQVAIVSFSDDAEVLAPMTPLTARSELNAAVDQLVTEGGTNLEDGLATGYEEAAKGFRTAATNRVIVLSDGLANQGSTRWQAILDKVADHAADRIALLTVGVGREYGDELMEQLADNGDGLALYVGTEDEAAEVFTTKLTATIELRARDAKAQVVFNPEVVESHRLVGYENRALAAEEFRDDDRDGGEIGPGHSVTALYALTLKPGADGHLAQATVRWQDPDTRVPSEAVAALRSGELAASLTEGSPRLQVDVLVAGFALHLRDGAAFGMDLPALREQAARLAPVTEDPMVAELRTFIDQVRTAD